MEYLGLNSNIQCPEIYSLGTQVSIATTQKRKTVPEGGDWPGSCCEAVMHRANNLSGVGLYP